MGLPTRKVAATLGTAVIDVCHIATGFGERLMGLMFQADLPPATAVYFSRCNSIHTCFMRFSIDVAFLDNQNRVVAIHQSVRPWRFLFPRRGYRNAIELKSGEILRLKVKLGDLFRLTLGGAR